MDSLYEPTPLERFCNWSPVCLRVTVFVVLLVFLDVVATVCTGGIGRLAFFALMPGLYPDSPDLGQWLDALEGDALSRLVLGAEETLFLHLALPKFEAEWSGQLQDSLRDLGLDAAFTPGLADFSGMGDHPNGYFLSQVIHAAKIQVNEKGTEAAAATVVTMPAAGEAPEDPPVELVFDRPFLYGIMDLQNGVPLFLGTYE